MMSNVKPALKKSFLLIIGILPLTGLVSLILTIHYINMVPSQENFAEAASYIKENFKDEDILRFEPSWGLSGASYFNGLMLDDTDEFDHNVVKIYKRLWIVAHLGVNTPVSWPEYKLLELKKLDDIDIYLYEIPYRGKPLYDFVDRLEDAKVKKIHKNGKTESCSSFKNREWRCSTSNSWEYVGEIVRDIAQSSRRVIWAHPLFKQTKLEILYSETLMGSELEVFYGFGQRSVETGEGAPVVFQIEINNKPVLAKVLKIYDDEWYHFSFDTSIFKGQKIPVKFLIYTSNPRDRQICFTGRTLP